MAKHKSTMEKLLTSVAVNPATDCWEWQKNSDRHGYGMVRADGKMRLAHRVSYEQFAGLIADGLTIDHLCRNRCCINPKHLEAVPLAENIRRSSAPQAVNARKTHCVNGHELTGVNLYLTPKGARQCRQCNLAAVARYKKRRVT